MNRSIFALMVSTFTLGLSEFMPMGLLPLIAKGLDISIPKAGMAVFAFAIGVMAAAPVMTLLLSKISKKKALISLLVIFTIGSVLSAISWGYNSFIISRIITSFSHASFFGIGAILAINLTPPAKRAGAVSLMFSGLTIANIGGVPLAAWVGELIGWRTAFIGTSFLGIIAMVALIFNIPQDAKPTKINIRTELTALIKPSVLLVFVGTVLFGSSLFTLYTYLSVILDEVTHATVAFKALIFCLAGIGFTLGGILGGKLAIRWSVDKTIIFSFLSACLVMLIYPIVASTYIGASIGTLLWGITGYAASPLLQTKIVSEAKDAPSLASSVNIGIFNIGNAVGAAVGGFIIASGLGYGWIAPAGGILSLFGAVVIIVPYLRTIKAPVTE